VELSHKDDLQPKNSKEPRIPLASRPQIELAIPDAVDFGLGEGKS